MTTINQAADVLEKMLRARLGADLETIVYRGESSDPDEPVVRIVARTIDDRTPISTDLIAVAEAYRRRGTFRFSFEIVPKQAIVRQVVLLDDAAAPEDVTLHLTDGSHVTVGADFPARWIR